jgi:hypothetical protein
MNVFTTDHPLVSQPSPFDSKKFPMVSFVCSSLIMALGFLPFVVTFYVYTVFSDAIEFGAEYDFPDSWTLFIVEVFGLCLFCSVLFVSAYRLVAWYFRNKRCDA